MILLLLHQNNHRAETVERAIEAAHHILVTKDTVRKTAKAFGVSKSCVHVWVTRVVPDTDPSLSERVALVLQYNKSIRHLRGGEATRIKTKKA